ncbi:MAG: MFS transporter [Terriglobales bacterium]
MLLSAATFMIFFQGYMVAPLIPRLATLFAVSPARMGLIVPAYLIAYGMAVLFFGPLSDRLGRKPVILASLGGFVLFTALTGVAQRLATLLSARFLTGLVASGVIPVAVALVGDAFPYEDRGRALGWLFGAMAGGMAFGSSVGAILEPYITWRGLFFGVALITALVVVALMRAAKFPARPKRSGPAGGWRSTLAAWWRLLATSRSQRAYVYVFLNAVFQSGVYTWLGYYFVRRYGLGEVGVGLALIGYGVPGLVLGPTIGRLADRSGRRLLIPGGLAVGGISALILGFRGGVLLAAVVVATLSLGYDMTQPLLAGVVTDLGAPQGVAVGLMAFVLFIGFGIGSIVFSAAMSSAGLGPALWQFGGAAVAAAVVGVPLFRGETAHSGRAEV